MLNECFLLYQFYEPTKETGFMKKQVKSLLQIKVTLNYNCRQVHSVISKTEQLMKQIVSRAKYALNKYGVTSCT